MSVKLIDLDPKWINNGDRYGVGIRFYDPSRTGAVRVLFKNPLDGGPPMPNDDDIPANNDGHRWERSGDSFDVLTLNPSIDGSPFLSHFVVVNGEVQ